MLTGINRTLKPFVPILYIIIILFGYQTRIEAEGPPDKPKMRAIEVPVQVGKIKKSKDVNKAVELKYIKDIKISRTSFNPKHNEELAIYYTLAKEAKVKITIYDPDNQMIREIDNNEYLSASRHLTIWDGKDLENIIVPNEAYYFILEAEYKDGTKELYDPTTFSGGIAHNIKKYKIDPMTYTINYKMPMMGRVLVRLGIDNGPLLKSLVTWKPRLAGMVNEYWNGKGQDGLIELINHDRLKVLIIYFTLEENSVITYGNKTITYLEYKKERVEKRPRKKASFKVISLNDMLSPYYSIPHYLNRDPQITVTFPKVKDFDSSGIPILKKKTLVHVELTDEDKKDFSNYEYEVCFFLDASYYAEWEAGHSPFNWVWNLSNVDEGYHILTTSIISVKNQIGISSHKVKIIK